MNRLRRLLMGASCALLSASAGITHAAACTKATPDCTEWVSFAAGPQRALVYRNHPLDARNEEIRRALIVIHGQRRTVRSYFRSAMAAAFLAEGLEDTVVIAPRFASNDGSECRDRLAADELNWICSGPESWRNGGAAIGTTQITSYHVADEILRRLARKDVFPNLSSIVIAGHSAGGQYTTRYAMANQSHDRIGVGLHYVVANPSSYTYPDALRPLASAFPPDVASAASGDRAPIEAQPLASFQPFPQASTCAGFDQWPYGLQKRVGYSAQLPPEQLIKQLATRPTTFLLGELDILPLYGFDFSCAAMAQGPTRLARGLAYSRYLNESYGARHRALVVPACGHNARCMFTANRVLPLLFPRS